MASGTMGFAAGAAGFAAGLGFGFAGAVAAGAGVCCAQAASATLAKGQPATVDGCASALAEMLPGD
jgi:hypothetical protein